MPSKITTALGRALAALLSITLTLSGCGGGGTEPGGGGAGPGPGSGKPLAHLKVDFGPASLDVGQRSKVIVGFVDAAGKPVPFDGAYKFSITGTTSSMLHDNVWTMTNGAASVPIAIAFGKPGKAKLTVAFMSADAGAYEVAGPEEVSAEITVAPARAASIKIVQWQGQPIPGRSHRFTVTMLDRFGNQAKVSGKGVLTFQGRDYPFEAKNVRSHPVEVQVHPEKLGRFDVACTFEGVKTKITVEIAR